MFPEHGEDADHRRPDVVAAFAVGLPHRIQQVGESLLVALALERVETGGDVRVGIPRERETGEHAGGLTATPSLQAPAAHPATESHAGTQGAIGAAPATH